MKTVYILILILVGGFVSPIYSQILDGQNRQIVTTNEGIQVTLIGEKILGSEVKSNNYYYLPTNLRLSSTIDGTPQFLFVQYGSDNNTSNIDSSGGLVHLLMEFGLTKSMENAVLSKLKKTIPLAKILGAATVTLGSSESIQLVTSLFDSTNDQKTLFSKSAPVLPGSKIAFSAKLNEVNSQIFAKTIGKNSSTTDLSIVLNYKYDEIMPAFKGYIIEDWSKLDSIYKNEQIKYEKKTPWWQTVFNIIKPLADGAISKYTGIGSTLGGIGDHSKVKYSELKEIYSQLEEAKVIQYVWEQYMTNQQIDSVRDYFFSYFKNRFTSETKDPPSGDNTNSLNTNSDNHAQSTGGGPYNDAIKNELYKSRSFSFKDEFYNVIKQKKTNKIDLRASFPIQRDFTLTENILKWSSSFINNDKCIYRVIASDPLYGNREINVMMDGVAKEMIDKMINYVAVDIRKKRSQEGYFDFSTQTIFDQSTLNEGYKKSFSISKVMEGDTKPFEYRVKWSLKGGYDYFEGDTSWLKGDWLGISLNAPIEPLKVTLNSDLKDFGIESKIRSVELQMRYIQFGKEKGRSILMKSSFPGEEISDTIYLDRNSKGYIYRLVYNHKELGNLATEWQSYTKFDRIDAYLPDDIINNNTIALKIMKDSYLREINKSYNSIINK